MLDLLKLFQGSNPDSPETELRPSQQSTEEIREEYAGLVRDELRRGGIPDTCVQVESRLMGAAPDGQPVFMCMLRMVQWQRRPVIRMLLGLPLLEKNIKRLVRGSWLVDVSHFGGLWVHPSTPLQSTEAVEDLRTLLVRLENEEGPDTSHDPVWSVPPSGDTSLGEL